MLLHRYKPEKTNIPDLELQEDIAFFEKGIVLQRIGWLLIFSLILLGGTGLFGNGLLSSQTVSSGMASVTYSKYQRFENQSELILNIRDGGAATIINFSSDYIRHFRFEQITPEPEATRTGDGVITYTFATGKKATIRFAMTPVAIGSIKGKVWVNTDLIQLSHFVYP